MHRIGRTGCVDVVKVLRDIALTDPCSRGGRSGQVSFTAGDASPHAATLTYAQSVTYFTGENHERALAGEFAGVLREGGVDCKELQERFPMTIKKVRALPRLRIR